MDVNTVRAESRMPLRVLVLVLALAVAPLIGTTDALARPIPDTDDPCAIQVDWPKSYGGSGMFGAPFVITIMSNPCKSLVRATEFGRFSSVVPAGPTSGGPAVWDGWSYGEPVSGVGEQTRIDHRYGLLTTTTWGYQFEHDGIWDRERRGLPPEGQAYHPKPTLEQMRAVFGADLARAAEKTPVQNGGGLRPRWKDRKSQIYEFDSQHNAIEKYTKNGRHIGEFDVKTGRQTKEADPGRRVTP